MKVLVLSDTHAPRFWKRVPERLVPELDRADLVLHAGDVCTPAVLDELAAFAPVHAVLGNNDGPAVADWGAGVPETLTVDLDGLRVGMVHDSGPKDGRGRRMRRLFPDAGLVVFGHSHIPWDTAEDNGLHLFNPGSPTDRRRQPVGTFGRLEIQSGRIVRHEIVPMTPAP